MQISYTINMVLNNLFQIQMPYLDSKIERNKHTKACNNPVGKRLYIRDYNDKGKTCFVSCGLICTTCGVVIKRKLSTKFDPKIGVEGYKEMEEIRETSKKWCNRRREKKSLERKTATQDSRINLRDCNERASHQ